MTLESKKILLGVCGGIAAYKCPELVRRLRDAGASVKVVMTAAAAEFIRPMTFQAVSGQEVMTDLLDERAEAAMGHIEMARWADLILVAPATANTLARIAAGFADDLLTTLCLASRAPLVVAPAMNNAMWENQATQENLLQLERRGVTLLGPASGAQACGEIGPGRMLEVAALVQACHGLLQSPKKYFEAPTKVLITAGPTREAIDPVRFISNHSSGKMGYALATAAASSGAQVTLVSGPVRLAVPANVDCIQVTSAQDMHREVMARAEACAIFIAVAAVADYRMAKQNRQKIKKSDRQLVLNLERNPDILSDVSRLVQRPFCVGFAAETNDVVAYARDKLVRKKLDMIVANKVGLAETGFNSDENAVEVLWGKSGQRSMAVQSKHTLAVALIGLIAKHFAVYQDGAVS